MLYSSFTITIKSFYLDDLGVTAIEYAILGSLVSIAIIIGVTATGVETKKLYDAVVAAFS